MASTYSTSLRLELIGQGEQAGTWGLTTNTNFGTLVEQAITGVQTISMSNATYTLSNFNGTADEARNAVLVMTGTNLAPQNLVAPSVEKVYIIKNTTGNTVNIKTSSGNAIAISNSTVAQVYCDGTDFYSAAPTINNLTGNFYASGTIASGGAMTSGGTLTAPTLSIAGTGSTGGTFTTGGVLYTPSGISNAGTLATGSTSVTGTLTTTGVLTTNSNLYVVGTSQFNGNVGMSGNLAVNGTLSATSIAGVTGTIKQIVTSVASSSPTTTSYSPQPSGHYAQITPTSASSKIMVLWYGVLGQTQYLEGENYTQAAMYRDGSVSSYTVGTNVSVLGGLLRIGASALNLAYVDSANTTGTITYQMYYWKDGVGAQGTKYNQFGGATITLLEISQ